MPAEKKQRTSASTSSKFSTAAPAGAAAAAAAAASPKTAVGGKRKLTTVAAAAAVVATAPAAAGGAAAGAGAGAGAARAVRIDLTQNVVSPTVSPPPLPPLGPTTPSPPPTAAAAAAAAPVPVTATVAPSAVTPSGKHITSGWGPVTQPSAEKGRRPTVTFTVDGKSAVFELFDVTTAGVIEVESAIATAPRFPLCAISDAFTIKRLDKPRRLTDYLFARTLRHFSFFLRCDPDDLEKAALLNSPTYIPSFYETAGFLKLHGAPDGARGFRYATYPGRAIIRYGLMLRGFTIAVSYGSPDDREKDIHERSYPELLMGISRPFVLIEHPALESMSKETLASLKARARCYVLITQEEALAHSRGHAKWGDMHVWCASGEKFNGRELLPCPRLLRRVSFVIGDPDRWVHDDTTPVVMHWKTGATEPGVLFHGMELYRAQLMMNAAVVLRGQAGSTVLCRALCDYAMKRKDERVFATALASASDDLPPPHVAYAVALGYAMGLFDVTLKEHVTAICAQLGAAMTALTDPAPEFQHRLAVPSDNAAAVRSATATLACFSSLANVRVAERRHRGHVSVAASAPGGVAPPAAAAAAAAAAAPPSAPAPTAATPALAAAAALCSMSK
jgi:hypothetical protein